MARIIKHKDDLLADLRYGREQSGKSYIAQILEAVRLMAGPGHLSPWDYHRYRLWDPALSWEQKREYIGDNNHGWLVHQVSSSDQESVMRDKFAAEQILRSGGVPMPRLQALYHPDREIEGTPVLRSGDELATFLRESIEYPFFYKPVTSNMSVGAGLARSYDSATDSIQRHGDPPVEVEEFAKGIAEYCRGRSSGSHRQPASGYLLQSVATNHPEIAELCGPTLATFRIYVITDDRGARIDRLSWKIPGPDSPADNFYREGNFYADVDPETGIVRRTLRGEGRRLEIFDHNPNNGKRMAGFQVPHFKQLCETVVRGAALFPGARYQGWDAAVANDGPLIVEANYGAALVLGQLSMGRGFLTPEFRDFVRRAKALNKNRSFAWPVSWSRHESIWRLNGILPLLKSLQPWKAKAS